VAKSTARLTPLAPPVRQDGGMPAATATSSPSRPADHARPEPTLLYMIKQVELVVRSHLDDVLRPSGVTVLQYTALTILERRSDLTTAELARNSFVTAQAMADMVTPLEQARLIERHRDPTNRRRLVISLTAKGRRLLDHYRDQVAQLEEEMLSGLTARQVTELRRSLFKCRSALADEPAH
jgi:DNA-binding MarR family transcriptional regulator